MNGELNARDFLGLMIAALAALTAFVWMPLHAVAGLILFTFFGENNPIVVAAMWAISVTGTVWVALLLARAK